MNAAPDESIRPASRLALPLAALGIVLAALLAYHNSFRGVFLLDDAGSIAQNASIRRLWPPWEALSPPADQTVGGRPVVNLTLAVNYALGGTDVRGYHAVNLAIHVLAALALLGIVRRTLLQPALKERFGGAALPLAFASALVWAVHPLQTESVTYVVQRCESLGSLLYLATLYFALRAMGAVRPLPWQAAACGACLLGMGAKEIVASAPLVVLLYDRTFAAGSFGEAWRRRRGFYACLATTEAVLAWQVWRTGHRGNSVLLELSGKWLQHVVNQFVAVATYLRLAVWPSPLVFDYGYALAGGAQLALSALLVLALLGATLWALRARPPLGFAGAFFFVVLASSSSLVPIRTQPIAEHRAYLALAAVVVVAVAAGYAGWKRLAAGRRGPLAHPAAPLVLLVCVVAALVALTVRRNRDYASDLAMWRDTVARRPLNPRAHNNLAEALQSTGDLGGAIEHYREVVRLKPDLFMVHKALADVLSAAGRPAEAVASYRQAIAQNPSYPEARAGLALALLKVGGGREALEQAQLLVRMQPADGGAHYNLATVQRETGDLAGAVDQLREAIRLSPDFIEAYNNLGYVLNRSGRAAEALPVLQQGLRLSPGDYLLRSNLGVSLSLLGRRAEAREQLTASLRAAAAKGDRDRARSIQGVLDSLP